MDELWRMMETPSWGYLRCLLELVTPGWVDVVLAVLRNKRSS